MDVGEAEIETTPNIATSAHDLNVYIFNVTISIALWNLGGYVGLNFVLSSVWNDVGLLLLKKIGNWIGQRLFNDKM